MPTDVEMGTIPEVRKDTVAEPQPVGPATETAIVHGKSATVPREVGPWGPPPKGDEVSFWGPPVGHYSVEYGWTCYDLNDHYSMPRTIGGFFIRTPVEAGINAIASVIMLGLLVYDVTTFGYQSVDWWTAPFKLIHFIFHVGVHIPANWSDEDGWDANKTERAICGAIFGIARYIVLFVYAWRMGTVPFLAQVALFAGLQLGKTEILGEVIKTFYAAAAILIAMLSQDLCSWAAYGVAAGLVIQLAGTGTFWLTGYMNGWYAKWWLREDDRSMMPYHVLSDIGNVLILVCASYTPGQPSGSMDKLLWTSSGSFPYCGIL